MLSSFYGRISLGARPQGRWNAELKHRGMLAPDTVGHRRDAPPASSSPRAVCMRIAVSIRCELVLNRERKPCLRVKSLVPTAGYKEVMVRGWS